VNPRIQCVRQGPGSRPSFMINPNGSALEPADGRIYPERAGLPAPVHRPRAPKVTISRRIRLSADPPPTPPPGASMPISGHRITRSGRWICFSWG